MPEFDLFAHLRSDEPPRFGPEGICGVLGFMGPLEAGGFHYTCDLPEGHDGRHGADGRGRDPQRVTWG